MTTDTSLTAAAKPAGNRLLDGPILPTLLRLSTPNMVAMVANAGSLRKSLW